jgi:hypothetical protein
MQAMPRADPEQVPVLFEQPEKAIRSTMAWGLPWLVAQRQSQNSAQRTLIAKRGGRTVSVFLLRASVGAG